ncbi:hypothetical protein CHL76_02465 [Marinococcus halophilus]|uniref:Uncharacterized protein n=1 Tax=Marinococcus halophilus TaxID=1371 RepID=A0A510Y2V6_MARHA|nr:hypothetical protein [Marinococcus halophilus]OZT81239.1 hypothetical protein CHL76_02465 [Marinococcus halophilus]GEK57181.1 hypothetical protein MHA01_00860 [Marinococcus halophilus]
MQGYTVEKTETEETIEMVVEYRKDAKSTPITVKGMSDRPSDEAIDNFNLAWNRRKQASS